MVDWLIVSNFQTFFSYVTVNMLSSRGNRIHQKNNSAFVKYMYLVNCIGCVMVSVLDLSAVDLGFETRLGQTNDYKIGIWCFSAKHVALKSKNKDGLAWNQDNVSMWSNMSTQVLLFQWVSTITIQLSLSV